MTNVLLALRIAYERSRLTMSAEPNRIRRLQLGLVLSCGTSLLALIVAAWAIVRKASP